MTTLDSAIAAAQRAAGEVGAVIARDDQALTATLELTDHAEWQAIEIDALAGHTFPVDRDRIKRTIRKVLADGIPTAGECDAQVDAFAARHGLSRAASYRVLSLLGLEALGEWT